MPFDEQPVLKSQLIELRPLRAGDYGDLRAVASDPLIWEQIAASRFHGYDSEESEVEIGWTFLARSHWGGLYNGHLKRLMLRHAFRFVKTVVFLVGPENLRSQRAAEKIGGVRVGSRPDADGRDSYLYRITAPELVER